jgi:hypothetical protein
MLQGWLLMLEQAGTYKSIKDLDKNNFRIDDIKPGRSSAGKLFLAIS